VHFVNAVFLQQNSINTSTVTPFVDPTVFARWQQMYIFSQDAAASVSVTLTPQCRGRILHI